jgi:hypothetical protein
MARIVTSYLLGGRERSHLLLKWPETQNRERGDSEQEMAINTEVERGDPEQQMAINTEVERGDSEQEMTRNTSTSK